MRSSKITHPFFHVCFVLDKILKFTRKVLFHEFCGLLQRSQSGKSTFMCNLLLWQNDIIDICFDYVTIILATEANKNEILSMLVLLRIVD